jgi:hypothetical protein
MAIALNFSFCIFGVGPLFLFGFGLGSVFNSGLVLGFFGV